MRILKRYNQLFESSMFTILRNYVRDNKISLVRNILSNNNIDLNELDDGLALILDTRDAQMIKLLHQYGANVNIINAWNNDILDTQGLYNKELISTILECGFSVERLLDFLYNHTRPSP